MIYKYEYNTQEERTILFEQNSNKRLCEEQNITEGNFLIFTDEPYVEPIPEVDEKAEMLNIIQDLTDKLKVYEPLSEEMEARVNSLNTEYLVTQ